MTDFVDTGEPEPWPDALGELTAGAEALQGIRWGNAMRDAAEELAALRKGAEAFQAERDELRRMRDEWKNEAAKDLVVIAALRKAADRFRKLEAAAKEGLLNIKGASCEVLPDMRTHWVLPTIMASGPVGGHTTFADAVDALP